MCVPSALALLSYGAHGTTIADQIDRDQFEREGYFIVNEILSEDEINEAVALIDQLLPPDAQPPLGSVDISTEPDKSGDKTQKSKITGS